MKGKRRCSERKDGREVAEGVPPNYRF